MLNAGATNPGMFEHAGILLEGLISEKAGQSRFRKSTVSYEPGARQRSGFLIPTSDNQESSSDAHMAQECTGTLGLNPSWASIFAHAP
jgi:hypothetical protein